MLDHLNPPGLFVCLGDRISSLGWSQTCYITEDDLEPLLLPPKNWDCRCVPPHCFTCWVDPRASRMLRKHSIHPLTPVLTDRCPSTEEESQGGSVTPHTLLLDSMQPSLSLYNLLRMPWNLSANSWLSFFFFFWWLSLDSYIFCSLPVRDILRPFKKFFSGAVRDGSTVKSL